MQFHAKNIAAFSLVILILIKMMGMPIAWVSYNLNKDYIAAELCVNKKKPSLHCNGQCVLMKKLAKANESNESKESKAEVKSLAVDFIEELQRYSINNIIRINPIHNLFRNKLYSSVIHTSIFHPPGVAA